MNKIEVNFTPCTPAPAAGYDIKYRVAGSHSLYKDAGSFFVSPAVFYDTLNPAGTCYEGYIRTDCGTVQGTLINWTSCGESGESGSTDIVINWDFINGVGAGARFRIIVNGVTMVNVTTSQTGSLSVEPGDMILVIVQSTVVGTAELNIAGAYSSSNMETHIVTDEFTALAGTYIIDGQSL